MYDGLGNCYKTSKLSTLLKPKNKSKNYICQERLEENTAEVYHYLVYCARTLGHYFLIFPCS